MTLTLDGLIEAIQSACDIERLQAELRDAMIERLIASSPPNDPNHSRAPTN